MKKIKVLNLLLLLLFVVGYVQTFGCEGRSYPRCAYRKKKRERKQICKYETKH